MTTVTTDLPTFIVIGAMKSGTTSLYHYLAEHPQVFMSRIKELNFFAAEANWSRGLEWYRQQFSRAGGALASGEASTLYTMYPHHAGVPERMASVVPAARLVYVVRDPLERLRSHYQHRVLSGAEEASLTDALLGDPRYVACSRYAMQLERYLDHFPREQVLVVTSESLRHDRAATVRDIYRFIGIDGSWLPPVLETEYYRTEQRASYPRVVWTARRLAKRYAPQAKLAKQLVDSVLTRRVASVSREMAAETAAGRPLRLDLPPGLHDRLADLLRDDVARLRRYMPPDFEGWGLV